MSPLSSSLRGPFFHLVATSPPTLLGSSLCCSFFHLITTFSPVLLDSSSGRPFFCLLSSSLPVLLSQTFSFLLFTVYTMFVPTNDRFLHAYFNRLFFFCQCSYNFLTLFIFLCDSSLFFIFSCLSSLFLPSLLLFLSFLSFCL